MNEDPRDTENTETAEGDAAGDAQAPDGGPLHGGEGDPLGEGVEDAAT